VISGTSWGSYSIPDYANHLENFTVLRSGDVLSWEFSLKVYDDTYDPDDPESSRVILATGKQSGLSIAYCDNDDPDEVPKTRDNFIGSDIGPDKLMSEWNDHWMNASVYGTLTLDDEQPNRPPEVAGNITDWELIPDGLPDTITSSLNDIFSDPDGDKLVYSVSSDNNVLNIRIEDDTMVVISASDYFIEPLVTVTASDGDYYANIQFTVHCLIDAVNAIPVGNLIGIYPNPAATSAYVRIDNNILGLVEIQVLDLSGRILVNQRRFKTAASAEYAVDLSELTAGIYMLQVRQGSDCTTKRIIHQ